MTVRGVIDDVSLDIYEGEILGLAGLAGSGRSSVARAIFGADRLTSGEVEVRQKRVRTGSPRHAIERGIAFVPEDRKNLGLETVLSQMVNVTLPYLRSLSMPFLGAVAFRRERREATDVLRKVDVRPLHLSRPVGELSGGNQQKVLFAKWLFRRPVVLLLDEPTRGWMSEPDARSTTSSVS